MGFSFSNLTRNLTPERFAGGVASGGLSEVYSSIKDPGSDEYTQMQLAKYGALGDIGKKVLGLGEDDDGGGKGGKKGLLATAKSFEEIAAEQWAIYKRYYAPYEIEAIKAKREFLPEFTRQTKEGIDVGKRQAEAGAEVMAQTKLGEGRRRRELSRYGIDPSSSTYGNVANIRAIETAKGVAGARTAAKTQAESEQYARLGAFLDKPTPDPYARTIQAYSGAVQSYAPLATRVLNDQPAPNPMGNILGLVGGGVGAYFGGPSGAAVGYGIGSQTGSMF